MVQLYKFNKVHAIYLILRIIDWLVQVCLIGVGPNSTGQWTSSSVNFIKKNSDEKCVDKLYPHD